MVSQEATIRILDLCSKDNEEPFFTRYEKMTKAIVGVLRQKGECYPKDLEALGFSSDEIEEKWAMAYAFAKVELNWADG